MKFALAAVLAWETLAMGTLAMGAVDASKAYEEQSVTFTGGDYKDEVFKFRLLKPAKIEPGKKYPVVMFLHGAGERGDDNRKQLQYLPEQMAQPDWQEKFPCFLIAPQCRERKQWVEVPWGDKDSTPTKELGPQMQVALKILDKVLKDNPVDQQRIYLTGLSMGGYGSWDLGMRMPERFACVVPICGGGDESHADRLVGMPVWAWHGDADEAVPVDRSRKMIAAIKKAGGDPKYTELPGVGHNSWTPAYSDPKGVVPWMFEQVKKKP